MAIIPNTAPVNGPIAPIDSEDTYPTHFANYGKGGFYTVSTLAERNLISTDRREAGLTVLVTDDPNPANNKAYTLGSGLSNTDWTQILVDMDTLTGAIPYADTTTAGIIRIADTVVSENVNEAVTPAQLISYTSGAISAIPYASEVQSGLVGIASGIAGYAEQYKAVLPTHVINYVAGELAALPNATTWSRGLVQLQGSIAGPDDTKAITQTALINFINYILPLGSIIMWNGNNNTVPAGWALCNGQTVNGITTPNLSEKFIRSANASGTNVGAFKDAYPALPAHTHSASWPYVEENYLVDDPSVPSGTAIGSGKVAAQGDPVDGPGEGVSTGDITVSVSTTGTYNNEELLPPYYVLAYIMRVG